jgi:hypothetical protein
VHLSIYSAIEPFVSCSMPKKSFHDAFQKYSSAEKEDKMAPNLEQEDAQYQADVQAVKQWWTDSRWRFTKRPFTAEDICAKRGNLTIQYPSNVMSKKLWNIVEERFKVSMTEN